MPPKQRPNTFVFDERSLVSREQLEARDIPFPDVPNEPDSASLRIAFAAALLTRGKHQRAYEASQREVVRLSIALAKAEKVAREQEG